MLAMCLQMSSILEIIDKKLSELHVIYLILSGVIHAHVVPRDHI